ncbi:MAG: lipoate--protein ligase family protein [Candidatus Micrarchaeia archaeon]
MNMFSYEYWGNNTLSISSNMAMEEYLLQRSEESRLATVRFWNVKKDAVVLGYSEATSAIKRRDNTFDVARRITGGSHVEFDENALAYTFTVPRNGSFKYFEDMRKYFAEKVGNALTDMGIDNVSIDNRASTINVDGRVIASHAIFWGVKSALMHGLLLIKPYDVDRIYERVALNERKIGRKTYTEYTALKNAPTVSAYVGVAGHATYISKENKAAYVKEIAAKSILDNVTQGRHKEVKLNSGIIAAAEKLVADKHTGDPWFNYRIPNYTEKEVEAIPGETLNGALKEGLGYCLYIQVPDKDFAKMAQPDEQ